MFEWLWGQPKTTAARDDEADGDEEYWLPDDARIPDDVRAQYGAYRDTVDCVVYAPRVDADEYWLFSSDGDLIDVLSIRY